MLSSVEIPGNHRSGTFAKAWENQRQHGQPYFPAIHRALSPHLSSGVLRKTSRAASRGTVEMSAKPSTQAIFGTWLDAFKLSLTNENWHFSVNQHLPDLHPSEIYLPDIIPDLHPRTFLYLSSSINHMWSIYDPYMYIFIYLSSSRSPSSSFQPRWKVSSGVIWNHSSDNRAVLDFDEAWWNKLRTGQS